MKKFDSIDEWLFEHPCTSVTLNHRFVGKEISGLTVLLSMPHRRQYDKSIIGTIVMVRELDYYPSSSKLVEIVDDIYI